MEPQSTRGIQGCADSLQNGKPVKFEDFVTGFLTKDRTAQFGKPVGLPIAPDGSLLFTDDTNGVIDRVFQTAK